MPTADTTRTACAYTAPISLDLGLAWLNLHSVVLLLLVDLLLWVWIWLLLLIGLTGGIRVVPVPVYLHLLTRFIMHGPGPVWGGPLVALLCCRHHYRLLLVIQP